MVAIFGLRLRVRNKGGFVVHFEGVDDRTAAERLNGVVLRAEPIDDPDAYGSTISWARPRSISPGSRSES